MKTVANGLQDGAKLVELFSGTQKENFSLLFLRYCINNNDINNNNYYYYYYYY